MQRIDAAWIAAHPLPPARGGDKNARGRVLTVGGAEFVPGALRLTGEAALRAGAGKLQLATVRACAMSLAVLMPEASMIALPADADGEIDPSAADLLLERLERCDVLVLGPGMSIGTGTQELVGALLRNAPREVLILLDAAALTCARDLAAEVAAHPGGVVMTPHYGEASHLMDVPAETIADDPPAAARQIVERFGSTVLLKGETSVLAGPEGDVLHFQDGCIGLATGGSGDVLAGIIGGLAARGASAIEATAWGAYIHGAAGSRLSREQGELGFLARELLPLIPALIAQAGRGEG